MMPDARFAAVGGAYSVPPGVVPRTASWGGASPCSMPQALGYDGRSPTQGAGAGSFSQSASWDYGGHGGVSPTPATTAGAYGAYGGYSPTPVATSGYASYGAAPGAAVGGFPQAASWDYGSYGAAPPASWDYGGPPPARQWDFKPLPPSAHSSSPQPGRDDGRQSDDAPEGDTPPPVASGYGSPLTAIPKSADSKSSVKSKKIGGASLMANAAGMWQKMNSSLAGAFQEAVEGSRKYMDDAAGSVFGNCSAKRRMRSLHSVKCRSDQRILIIGPGFGVELNPRQAEMVTQAGFQLHWVRDIPNPEKPGFPVADYLPVLQSAIEDFQPHLIACASKGGHYMIALWQTGLWNGPSLMINAHPSLKELPKDVPIVVAQGSNDELYSRSRADLESLIATGSRNKCFLYFTGNSGRSAAGFARVGDRHNMESLLQYDCLPRLMDAALCGMSPEMHVLCSWCEQLPQERLDAERWLSYCPDELQRLWASTNHKGLDEENLFEVPSDSLEYKMVATMFHSAPREPAAYGTPSAEWDQVRIVNIERVENGWQEEGSARPYYTALRKSIEEQGVAFEPGVHTRWVFHGTDAIESIICNPLAGFQPLASGSRLGSVWGSGTYFARDAKYVFDGHFCQPSPDGTGRMLMCLAMTGIPCLGDPEQKGVLPFRQKPHRYNSAVDSLSSPEIFIVQHPSAAYPAYLITFA